MYRQVFIIILLIYLSLPAIAVCSKIGSLGLVQPDSLPETHWRALYKQAHFRGRLRTYWMQTNNAAQLTDYHAFALGAGGAVQSGQYKGFSVKGSFFITANLFSSDLSRPDSITGQPNRYEIGLFDITDPGKRFPLMRIEELQFRYHHKWLDLTWGRQILHTPFINTQDGRMAPTAENGISLKFDLPQQWQISTTWLYKISPRSTTRWYNPGYSIGLYPQGRQTNGQPSHYARQLKSSGVAILSANKKWTTGLQVEGWNYLISNLLNTAFFRLEGKFLQHDSLHFWYYGLQYTRQDALASKSNLAKAYIDAGARSNTGSLKIGQRHGHWQETLAYTRVTSDGRFLMPREWGVEPFYTFLPHERIEGAGDTHAYMAKLVYFSQAGSWEATLGYGYYALPDVKNAVLNKYNVPSFHQLVINTKYVFKHNWRGLTLQLLYLAKINQGNTYGDEKNRFNKTDMQQFNFIMNYSFGSSP